MKGFSDNWLLLHSWLKTKKKGGEENFSLLVYKQNLEQMVSIVSHSYYCSFFNIPKLAGSDFA